MCILFPCLIFLLWGQETQNPLKRDCTSMSIPGHCFGGGLWRKKLDHKYHFFKTYSKLLCKKIPTEVSSLNVYVFKSLWLSNNMLTC